MVEGVGFLAPAHGDVDPLPFDPGLSDRVRVAGGGALGFVAGDCISVGDMSVVEIPPGNRPGLVVTVKPDGDGPSFRVGADDGGEISVEDTDISGGAGGGRSCCCLPVSSDAIIRPRRGPDKTSSQESLVTTGALPALHQV